MKYTVDFQNVPIVVIKIDQKNLLNMCGLHLKTVNFVVHVI